MNASERKQHSATLRAAGYEDDEALTLKSADGAVPSGRELSIAWLAGTIMTGLTSVLLMGAALYMAFLGQDTFSTPYHALTIESSVDTAEVTAEKTDRLVVVTTTRSEREVIEASIRESDGGVARIRLQPFDRIRATLATSATELANDIPRYDPVALLNRTQSQDTNLAEALISTEIYGSEVEGEIVVKTAALDLSAAPTPIITDQVAAEFVRLTAEGSYAPGDNSALGYAAESASFIELSPEDELSMMSVAENVSTVQKSKNLGAIDLGTSERIINIRNDVRLGTSLSNAGFTEGQIIAVLAALPNLSDQTMLSQGAHLRVLFGPNFSGTNVVPQRASVYAGERHIATAALTDQGTYVSGQEPSPIEFPENDIEEVNVNNLPSIYRSIWETARKYELPDTSIDRVVSMFAFDIDLTQRISAGDAIEILQTEAEDPKDRQLLYVALTLDGVKREFFRHQSGNGDINFFDEDGQSGKRFLMRRPLEGGGNLRSRYGYRIHPIFKTRKLHTGVDLSAPTGTPIYASGDGIIKRAQWVGGYGRYIEMVHVNGYSTAYAHMTRFANGMSPGTRVRQGQVIGYVGSTGYSTGPHLHFEIKINGNTVDPLSVRLPRSNTLPASDQSRFAQTVEQIRDLMDREIAPEITIASLN